MKLLYVKNGDVTAQLRRYNPEMIPKGGPDAFFSDLMLHTLGDKLLISWDVKDDVCVQGHAKSITYKVSRSSYGAVGNLFNRIVALIHSTFIILKFYPDRIICGRVGSMLWLIYIISLVTKIPFIHSRHNSLINPGTALYKRISSSIDAWVIRRAKGVICHGPYLRDELISLDVDKDKIFEFDVAYDRFSEPDDKNSINIEINSDLRILTYIGRVDSSKGVFDLLEVFTLLIEEYENLHLVYIGEGPGLKELKSRVNELDLGSSVSVLGKLEHKLLPIYINSSYLMIAPTRSEFPEGRCMSVMEGLACGIPVICPDNGPFPYLIKDKVNGRLYTVDNNDSLLGVVSDVLSNKKHYAQIKEGALQSIEQLKRPPLYFSEAVSAAFESKL